MSLPPPEVFSLPDKYTEWRPLQDTACESILEDDPRFLVLTCPTGFGKSLVYMAASQIFDGRTVILTSTKGLQTQLMADFGEMEGVCDIRGRGNYPCRLNTKLNCDMGLCMFGLKCSMRESGGCAYFDRLREAKRATVVITNYSYWMSQNEYSDGIGDFDLLVLDEAHSAPQHLIDHVGVTFQKTSRFQSDVLRLRDKMPSTWGRWLIWAEARLEDVQSRMEQAKINRKEKRHARLRRIEQSLLRLTSIDDTWIWEDNDFQVSLSPIWSAPFAEEILFLDTPKVVLTSATVVPKTAELLGVPSEEMRVDEYPHFFPIENRRLVHIPTVRMNYRNGELENRQWISRVDQIIRDRQMTKGIIHTISYARRDLLIGLSKYSNLMMTHDSKNTEFMVEAFKGAEPPCILVSPSMTTGYDFPGDECRWQIIVKVPYPDTRGKIIQARSKDDADYVPYLIMQQLIQACGRGVRSEDDWCECFCTDNNITWSMDKYTHLTVDWFRGAYMVARTVPKPLI